jgi:hypothetical protein
MHFYILFISVFVALVSAQNRHIYVATRALQDIPQNWRGVTVEYLSADGSVGVIAHWAVLFSEYGQNSPEWRPDSIKDLGTLFELNSDDRGMNQIKIDRRFRPREADGWTFKWIGTTSDTDDQLRTTGSILLLCFIDFIKPKNTCEKSPGTL